ncbi:hypothetical protein D6C93_10020 [Aureobasidium pullulans]|nr:hypothetical protein D6C93_10020 [Aureobasidium pullulans]
MIRAVTEDDTGIEVLYQPSNPNIDIVAIHGLGAHPDDTWCKNIGTPETSNVRIMRYGYESAWFGSDAIKQSTTDAAEEFLDDLKGLREAMIHARLHSKRWPDLLSFTTGLIFFGTPFRGAEGISQSELLQAAIEEHKVVEAQALRILDPGNDPLEDLVTDFCRLHSVPHKAQIACFFEQKPSNIMAIVGKNAQKSFVVSRSSGCLDESESTQKYRLARTHFDMNKFGKPSERGFTKVAQVVKGMVEAAPNLLLSRLEVRVDEPKSIAAVRRLVEVTDSSLEEERHESTEKVQKDISTAIELAFQKANFTRGVMTDSRLGPQPAHHAIDDVESILAIVRLNTTVKINKRTQHRFSSHSTSRLVTQALHDSIDLANGKFDILTTKRSTEAGRDVSFMSVITFTANESQYKQFMLSMHLIQIHGLDGSNAIRDKNLEEFKRLLENGQARVWDRDSEGRGLLNFAIYYVEPRMAEYLIAQGLDAYSPDSVRRPSGGPSPPDYAPDSRV